MTQAEIRTSVRNLANEKSTDAGALLESDNTMIDDMIADACEEVVMDLIPTMPSMFLDSENLNLTIAVEYTAISKENLWIWKIAKNVSGDDPVEIDIIDPLSEQYYKYVGETAEEPEVCYLRGNTVYWLPTPSANKTAYAKAYLVVPEAATMATGGPVYIPRIAHRLIVYKAVWNIAIVLGMDYSAYLALYTKRLEAVKSIYRRRVQSAPRFIRESVRERQLVDRRDKAFFDKSGFLGR